jgi:hypothetical protein
MEVEHRPAWSEERVDVAQGVHDALVRLDSSQGRREQRDVEAPKRCFDLGCPDGDERHTIGEVGWPTRQCLRDSGATGARGRSGASRRVVEGRY